MFVWRQLMMGKEIYGGKGITIYMYWFVLYFRSYRHYIWVVSYIFSIKRISMKYITVL